MFHNLKKAWRVLSNSLPVAKAHSNLSLNQAQIELESQLVDPLQAKLKAHHQSLSSQLSPSKPKETYPYWVSFRDYEDSFVGVVICRGTSPGAAANSAIKRGIVESEKATIKLINELHWALLSNFTDRLLDERSAVLAAEAAGIPLKRDSKES